MWDLTGELSGLATRNEDTRVRAHGSLDVSERRPDVSRVVLTRQIDYEYPKTPQDAQGYVHLLRELRAGLDHLAQSKGKRRDQYELTVAAPCGPENMNMLDVPGMDQVRTLGLHSIQS